MTKRQAEKKADQLRVALLVLLTNDAPPEYRERDLIPVKVELAGVRQGQGALVIDYAIKWHRTYKTGSFNLFQIIFEIQKFFPDTVISGEIVSFVNGCITVEIKGIGKKETIRFNFFSLDS